MVWCSTLSWKHTKSKKKQNPKNVTNPQLYGAASCCDNDINTTMTWLEAFSVDDKLLANKKSYLPSAKPFSFTICSACCTILEHSTCKKYSLTTWTQCYSQLILMKISPVRTHILVHCTTVLMCLALQTKYDNITTMILTFPSCYP